MNDVNILHITPHLGGGVGQVLLNYLSFDKNHHTVATLDYANEKAISFSQKYHFILFSKMYDHLTSLLQMIEKFDIVIVHFWNHPLLYDFLLNNPLPSARVIFWAHISGIEAPYVFSKRILNYPDKFVFTTPISLETKEVKDFECKEKLSVIFSTGGVQHVQAIKRKKHDNFIVGYIGTVDYAKMHPDYVKIHKEIGLQDIRFLIIGGDQEKQISESADDRFIFTGKVLDICPYLEQFDVFGYLLNENHYGTAEQVLQEAMAVGVVPVVLNNPAERHIVQHGQTGLVAHDIDEYKKYIHLLYRDKNLRAFLSRNAKEYADKNFSIETLAHQWIKIYQDVLKIEKKERRYNDLQAYYEPIDLFFESIGEYRQVFASNLDGKDPDSLKAALKLPQWASHTKGTPKHYYYFFPGDKKLEEICKSYYT